MKKLEINLNNYCRYKNIFSCNVNINLNVSDVYTQGSVGNFVKLKTTIRK